MQWTTKSSEPQSASTSSKTASMVAPSVTSQWPTTAAVELLRQGLDALLQGVALIGEGEFRARAGAPPAAMPQAIERLFATPMMRPRLPARMPGAVSAMGHLDRAEKPKKRPL